MTLQFVIGIHLIIINIKWNLETLNAFESGYDGEKCAESEYGRVRAVPESSFVANPR